MTLPRTTIGCSIRFSAFARQHLPQFGPAFSRSHHDDARRRVRIGWLSPRFSEGPVASFLTGLARGVRSFAAPASPDRAATGERCGECAVRIARRRMDRAGRPRRCDAVAAPARTRARRARRSRRAFDREPPRRRRAARRAAAGVLARLVRHDGRAGDGRVDQRCVADAGRIDAALHRARRATAVRAFLLCAAGRCAAGDVCRRRHDRVRVVQPAGQAQCRRRCGVGRDPAPRSRRAARAGCAVARRRGDPRAYARSASLRTASGPSGLASPASGRMPTCSRHIARSTSRSIRSRSRAARRPAMRCSWAQPS